MTICSTCCLNVFIICFDMICEPHVGMSHVFSWEQSSNQLEAASSASAQSIDGCWKQANLYWWSWNGDPQIARRQWRIFFPGDTIVMHQVEQHPWWIGFCLENWWLLKKIANRIYARQTSGMEYKGTLKSIDQYMNLQILNTEDVILNTCSWGFTNVFSGKAVVG